MSGTRFLSSFTSFPSYHRGSSCNQRRGKAEQHLPLSVLATCARRGWARLCRQGWGSGGSAGRPGLGCAAGGHRRARFPAGPAAAPVSRSRIGQSLVTLAHPSFGAVRGCPPAPGSVRPCFWEPRGFFLVEVAPPGARPCWVRRRDPAHGFPTDTRTRPTGGLLAAGALTLASFGSSGKQMDNAEFL